MLKLQSLQNMSKNQINKGKINSVELSKKKKKRWQFLGKRIYILLIIFLSGIVYVN